MDLNRWLRNQLDRVIAVVLAVAGAIAILLGWLGVSRVTLPVEQISYLASGAVFGLFLLGIAGTVWLSADLRDEWRKLDDGEAALRDAAAAVRELAATTAEAQTRDETSSTAHATNGTAGGRTPRRTPLRSR